jgi:hypothetical protein
MDLSDFFNSINKTKKSVITDERSERLYVPYVVNKSMSYHKDAIFHSNLINGVPGLDRKMQYDYYLYALPKASRYGKWQKPDNSPIESIMAFYGYSRDKAEQVAQILTESQLKAIQEHLNTGGKS